jgi:hypothetical protein
LAIGISVSSVGQPRSVRDLILRSFRIAHILGHGEPLGHPEASEAFYQLNDLVDQANTDKLFAVFQTEIIVPLTPLKQTYAIGPYSASPVPDVVTVRPVEILSAFSRRDDIDYGVFVSHEKTDYDRVILKGLTVDGYSTAVYYQAAYPAGTIYVYPVPVNSGTSLHLTVHASITQFGALEDEVIMPPMYFSWLQYKLAERLCPEYGQTWSKENEKIVSEVEDVLIGNNIKPMPVSGTGLCGLASGRVATYNIQSDSVGR